ncbi:MAG: hypothetical protein U0794_16325 [Isosphaeraceae bacterium]
MLGEFVRDARPTEAGRPKDRNHEVPPDSAPVNPPQTSPPPLPPEGAREGSFDPLTGLLLETAAPLRPATDSMDALATLGVETGVNLLDSTTSNPNQPAFPTDAGTAASPIEEDLDESVEDSRGLSWPVVLLASYASAVTIGLIWVLLSGRRLPESGPAEPPAADISTDDGRRAGSATRLVVGKRTSNAHIVNLGETIRLGALEVTPIEISKGHVTLERLVGPGAKRDGGADALLLRVGFRNVSPDLVLAPLDEAFIREREPGRLDSFIDLGPGKPLIEMYPLAVDSEWSIVGQDFRDLRPAESYETLIVSAPDSVGTLGRPAVWRLRLRTGINATEEMGVQFSPEDVRSSDSETPRPRSSDR